MKNTLLIAGLGTAIALGALTSAYAAGDGKHHGGMHHKFEELDANGDGQLTREEMETHMQARFDGADTDGNGALSSEELIAQMMQRQAKRMAKYAAHMLERHDANGDGELSPEEMLARHDGKRFDKMDTNGDGTVSAEEFAQARAKHKHKHKHKHKQENAE